MAFRFQVKKSGRLPTADAWLLDGKLLSGKVRNNSLATVEAEKGKVVKVKTVALLNQKNPDPSELTLTLEEPSFDIESLEGKVLVAA